MHSESRPPWFESARLRRQWFGAADHQGPPGVQSVLDPPERHALHGVVEVREGDVPAQEKHDSPPVLGLHTEHPPHGMNAWAKAARAVAAPLRAREDLPVRIRRDDAKVERREARRAAVMPEDRKRVRLLGPSRGRHHCRSSTPSWSFIRLFLAREPQSASDKQRVGSSIPHVGRVVHRAWQESPLAGTANRLP